MSGFLSRSSAPRVSRRQMVLASAVSGAVSLLIVTTVPATPGPDAAAIAALRARSAALTTGGLGGTSPSGGGGLLGGGALSGALPALPTGGVVAAVPTSPAAAPAPAAPTTTGAAQSSGSSQSGGGGSSGGGSRGAAKPKSTSPIKHVFVVALTAASYQATFGDSVANPYLVGTLRPKGELLEGYDTVSGQPLPDSLALISGQPANSNTTANCPSYVDFPAGSAPNRKGIMAGDGCVYPNTVITLGDQFDGARLHWSGYVDGMTGPCVHPNSGASDSTAANGYDPRDNPFLFFHSLLDLGDCQSYDLPLTDLSKALSSRRLTPDLVYVAADACDGGGLACPSASGGGTSTTTTGTTTTGEPTTTTGTGTTGTVTTGTGTTGSKTTGTTPVSTTTTGTSATPTSPGPSPADAFLRRIVPEILKSRAYKTSGALLILFDGNGSSAAGTQTGGLLLSPFIRPGSTEKHNINAYSVLRSLDGIFGLDRLGLAATAEAVPLVRSHRH